MDWLKKPFRCEPAKPVEQSVEPKVDPYTAEAKRRCSQRDAEN